MLPQLNEAHFTRFLLVTVIYESINSLSNHYNPLVIKIIAFSLLYLLCALYFLARAIYGVLCANYAIKFLRDDKLLNNSLPGFYNYSQLIA